MYSKNEWRHGDLVQLKSGGPVMTVETQNAGNRVRCWWFRDDMPVSQEFHPDLLKKALAEDRVELG